jgi:kynureninase
MTTAAELSKKAGALDRQDPLKAYRKRFHYPTAKGAKTVYLCGNSLGLMPKGLEKALAQECKDWARWAVEGHWKAKHPWVDYHQDFSKLLAPLCGAKKHEVVAMNSLTVNLHLALASFYKPTKKRFLILHEHKAFSSDLYALASAVEMKGLDPSACLIGVDELSSKQILKTIRKHADQLALVLLGGVNYYTGEVLDMQKITKAAHEAGALVGFDLAHAIGNVPLKLHAWKVDFAVWCSYKYLNAGPGAAGGLFVHEKHGRDAKTPRLAGWWGHDKKSRFAMPPLFQPMSGAEGWQLSNAPVFNMVAQRLSLHIFHDAGLAAVYEKGTRLSNFFLECLSALGEEKVKETRPYAFELITPLDEERRACQLSFKIQKEGHTLFQALEKAGFMGDWREPQVIRISPVPLYNTYTEVYQVAAFLCKRAYWKKG